MRVPVPLPCKSAIWPRCARVYDPWTRASLLMMTANIIGYLTRIIVYSGMCMRLMSTRRQIKAFMIQRNVALNIYHSEQMCIGRTTPCPRKKVSQNVFVISYTHVYRF